jgi:MFS family permease
MSRLSERFPALASRDFRYLWLGQIISAAGSQMQFAALNWQIYDLTGSPVALGMIGLVRVIPILFFSLIGGTVADAYDRRKLLIGTQSLLTAVAVTLALLSHQKALAPLGIYLLTAIGAAAIAFDNPARQALIPSLVPREHLPNAFALNSTGMQVATIAGPVLAGQVLARMGASWAYLFNALSFLAVITALLLLRFRPLPTSEPLARPSWESLKEGIRFVRTTPILVASMTLDFWATFFSSATALLPIFARDILKVGPQGFGLLSAFPAMGSLLTGVLLTLLPPARRQGYVMLWAVFAYGLATIGFGLTGLFPSVTGGTFLSGAFIAAALFLAGTGAADTVSTVLRQTIRQTVTPDRLRGRMVSVNMIFFMGGPQLGELEAGLVAQWYGAVASVVSGGIGCLLTAGTVALRAPWLRRYELSRHEEADTPAAAAAR